jgi:hypothetical protein
MVEPLPMKTLTGASAKYYVILATTSTEQYFAALPYLFTGYCKQC